MSIIIPLENLSAEIRTFDINSNEIFSKILQVGIEENSSKKIFDMPRISGTTIYYVDLRLKDQEGNIVGRNFYWISTKEDVLDWENTQ